MLPAGSKRNRHFYRNIARGIDRNVIRYCLHWYCCGHLFRNLSGRFYRVSA
jgi:hypothetical protein